MLRRFEIYALRPDAPAAARERLRCALRDCARFIPEVRHSAIGSNLSAAPLQLVWEHAYASPEAYQRYMVHPFHADVLDRHLLADSPERVVADSALGAGLLGYGCEAADYHLPGGVRRLVLLRLADDAPGDRLRSFATAAHEARAQAPQLAVSVFAENSFATRWFDGVSEIPGRRSWTHLWEQGFRSNADLAAYRAGGSTLAQAERGGWSGWLDGIVESSLEIIYTLEPGWGYEDPG